MKYYIAIVDDAKVHTAVTRYNIGDLVQVDLTRDQVFSMYSKLQDIRLYTTPEQACDEAFEKYHLDGKDSKQISFFKQKTLEKSTDKNLLSIYGEGAVFSKIDTVSIIYEVEVNDNSILQEEKEGQFSISKINQDKIELQSACVQGILIYFTDEFAKQNQIQNTTINLIDHSSLTNRPSCMIQ